MSEENVDWRDGLSDELRDNPSLSDVKDLNGLAQRFIDTKAMVGNSIRPPTDDAPQEDIESFVEQMLGNSHIPLQRRVEVDINDRTPEDAGGYNLVEGFDAEAYGELAKFAHEKNMPKSMLEGIAGEMMRLNQKSVDANMEPFTAEMSKLKGEWGGAYDEKVERIQQFIKANKSELDFAGGVANNQVGADWLRLFDGIVSQFGGEGTEVAKQMSAATQRTPGEIEQRRNEVTKSLINDNLTPRERDGLQAKLVKYSQDLIEARAA